MSKSKVSRSTHVSIPQVIEPRLLSVREAARYLGVAVWCLRSLVWEKQLTPVKIGASRRFVFDRADLDAYIERQKKAAA